MKRMKKASELLVENGHQLRARVKKGKFPPFILLYPLFHSRADALNAGQILAQNIAAKFDEENDDHGDGSDSEGEEEADIQNQTKGFVKNLIKGQLNKIIIFSSDDDNKLNMNEADDADAGDDGGGDDGDTEEEGFTIFPLKILTKSLRRSICRSWK